MTILTMRLILTHFHLIYINQDSNLRRLIQTFILKILSRSTFTIKIHLYHKWSVHQSCRWNSKIPNNMVAFGTWKQKTSTMFPCLTFQSPLIKTSIYLYLFPFYTFSTYKSCNQWSWISSQICAQLLMSQLWFQVISLLVRPEKWIHIFSFCSKSVSSLNLDTDQPHISSYQNHIDTGILRFFTSYLTKFLESSKSHWYWE